MGVNEFVEAQAVKPALLSISPEIEARQRQRVAELRASRNQMMVESCLCDLRDAAQGTNNLMPPILNCVEQYATVGEIAGALRGVFGEYRARA